MAKLNGPRFWFVTPEPHSGQVYSFLSLSDGAALDSPLRFLSRTLIRPRSERRYALDALSGQKAAGGKVLFAQVTLPAKMNFPDFAFIGRSRAKSGELDPWQLLCDSSLLYWPH